MLSHSVQNVTSHGSFVLFILPDLPVLTASTAICTVITLGPLDQTRDPPTDTFTFVFVVFDNWLTVLYLDIWWLEIHVRNGVILVAAQTERLR